MWTNLLDGAGLRAALAQRPKFLGDLQVTAARSTDLPTTSQTTPTEAR